MSDDISQVFHGFFTGSHPIVLAQSNHGIRLVKHIVFSIFLITDGDTLCFIDFRADRMRQISEAFGIKPPFETDVIPKDLVRNNYMYL